MTTWRLGENRAQRGKHRTEVTEVTEGGLGLVARNSIGDNHGVWARIGRNGESIAQRSRRSQRGDLGWWPGIRSATIMASGRESGATGKASHRGHARSQRGIAGWRAGIRSVKSWRLGENRRNGLSSVRGFSQLTPGSSLRTYRPPPQFPHLRGLCDLCAMQSSLGGFSR